MEDVSNHHMPQIYFIFSISGNLWHTFPFPLITFAFTHNAEEPENIRPPTLLCQTFSSINHRILNPSV